MNLKLEHKTHKVLDLEPGDGTEINVVLDYTAKKFPFKVYRVYWDCGKHQKKINEFGDMRTCLRYLEGLVRY